MELITVIIGAVATILAPYIVYKVKIKNKKNEIYNKLKYHSIHRKMET